MFEIINPDYFPSVTVTSSENVQLIDGQIIADSIETVTRPGRVEDTMNYFELYPAGSAQKVTVSIEECEAHKYIFVGAVSPVDRTLKTCDRPNEIGCLYCSLSFQINCNSQNSEECEKCELRYRNNVRAVLRMPMLASRPGTTFLLTLTAPGAQMHCTAHLWKDKQGKMQPNYRCEIIDAVNHATGELMPVFASPECSVCPCSQNSIASREEVAAFNFSMARKWNDFTTYLRRLGLDSSVGGRGNKSVRPFEKMEFAKAFEPQKRGALHAHAVIRVPQKFVLTPTLLAGMKAAAMQLGFGHQFDVQTIGEDLGAITAARYVAKYITKRNQTEEVDIPFPNIPTDKQVPRDRSFISEVCCPQPTKLELLNGAIPCDGKHHDIVSASLEELSRICPCTGSTLAYPVVKAEVSIKLFSEDGIEVVFEKPGFYSSETTRLKRTKKKPPRAWSVSRGWGLTLGFIRKQQAAYFESPKLAQKMMFNQLMSVFSQQMGIADFFSKKPMLELTT